MCVYICTTQCSRPARGYTQASKKLNLNRFRIPSFAPKVPWPCLIAKDGLSSPLRKRWLTYRRTSESLSRIRLRSGGQLPGTPQACTTCLALGLLQGAEVLTLQNQVGSKDSPRVRTLHVVSSQLIQSKIQPFEGLEAHQTHRYKFGLYLEHKALGLNMMRLSIF